MNTFSAGFSVRAGSYWYFYGFIQACGWACA